MSTATSHPKTEPLRHWLWRSYVRLSLLPVLLLGLILTLSYLAGIRLTRDEGVSTVQQMAEIQLRQQVAAQARLLRQRLVFLDRQARRLARSDLTGPSRNPRLVPLPEPDSGVVRVRLFDQDGWQRLWPAGPSAGPADSVPPIPAPGQVVWTPPRRDERLGWLVTALTPVPRSRAEDGMLGLDLSLSALLDNPVAGHDPGFIDGVSGLKPRDTLLLLPGATPGGSVVLDMASKGGPVASVRPLEQRPELIPLLDAFTRPAGLIRSAVAPGSRLIAWSTLPETDWTVLVVADEGPLLGQARSLHDRLDLIGQAMLLVLVVVLLSLWGLLYWHNRQQSRAMSRSLARLGTLAGRIGGGEYYQEPPHFGITELQGTAEQLVLMGRRLGDNHHALLETQTELAVSETCYRSVVDTLHEVVFQTDDEGYWTFLNARWETITGHPVADCIGRPFMDFVHPDHRNRSLTGFGLLIRGRRDACRHEIRCLHRNDGHRWLKVHVRGIRNEQGRVIGTAGTLDDITHRHAVESHLRLTRSALDQCPYALVLLDADARLVAVNRHFEKLTGWSLGRLRHRDLAMICHPPPSIKTLQSQGLWEGSLRLRRAGDDEVALWLQLTAARGEHGRLLGYTGCLWEQAPAREMAGRS